MWDCPAASGTRTQTVQSLAAEASSSAAGDAEDGPGDAANVAPIGVEAAADGSELRLAPGQGLPADPATTFPVYIDPQTCTPKAGEWTMVSRYCLDSTGRCNTGLSEQERLLVECIGDLGFGRSTPSAAS